MLSPRYPQETKKEASKPVAAPSQELNNSIVSLYGTLIVAIIAGAFSLLGLVISKEQKVSEFRQIWIDALRNDVAELIAYANIIHAALLRFAKQPNRDADQFLEKNSENYIKVNSASSRIKLRLNGKEKESELLLNHISTLEALLGKEPEKLADSQEEIEPINKRIQTGARRVLKSEWQRVKRGEWQYRVAKSAAIALTLAALFSASLAVRSGFHLGLFQ
jgi:hypothetical protein